MFSASPLLRLLLPMAAGIGLGEYAYEHLAPHPHITSGLWGIVVAAFVGAVLLVRTRRPILLRVQTALTLLIPFVMGILILWAERRERTLPWPMEVSTQMPIATTYCAKVCTPPQRTEKSWRTRLQILNGKHSGQSVEAVLVDHRRPLHLGDRVVVHFAIRPLLPHRNPGQTERATLLRRQGVTGTGVCFTRNWQVLSGKTPPTLFERALLLREEWAAHYQTHFSHHNMAVLSAMTLGRREWIDAETRTLYSQTGASHILALSGLHLAILYAVFEYTLGAWSRRRSRTWQVGVGMLGLLLIWSFAFLTGFPTSLVRAALMFSIARLLQFFSHRPSPFHSLTLTILIMLMVSPSWLFDVGFQLSCAAVIGILGLRPLFPTPKWLNLTPAHPSFSSPSSLPTRWLKQAGRAVYALFTVSLSAQAATAPLVAYYFNLLPLIGGFASLVVIPAAYLLLSGSLIFLLLPFARPLSASLLSSILETMESVLRFLQTLPGGAIEVHPTLFTLFSAYLFLLLGVALAHRPPPDRRRWLFRSGGILLFITAAHFVYTARQRARIAPEVRIYHTHGVTALHFIANARKSYLLATDTLQARRALAQTARRDWNAHGLNVTPLSLPLLNTSEGSILLQQRCAPSGTIGFAPRVVLFAHRRYAIVTQLLPLFPPRAPLSVDVLLLTRGARNHLPRLLLFYRPRLLILSADLSDAYRRRYLQEAAARHLPVFDIARQGAFLEKISPVHTSP